MFNGHPAGRVLKDVLAGVMADEEAKKAKATAAAANVLDSTGDAKADEKTPEEKTTEENPSEKKEPEEGAPEDKKDDKKSAEIFDSAADYAEKDISLKAIANLIEFAETTDADLDEGESLSDRLCALMIGIADANMDGEIGDDEQAVLEIALNTAWDYLASKGASEDDINALLNDWDDEAGIRIRNLLAEKLPDGDAANADADSFVFGDGADEATFDAVYKKKIVIRDGKKTRINKRISGKVRLSAKQKIGIRKAGMRSHSAAAMMHRAKSVRLRNTMGLNK